ncbi:hypothetical protein CAOG_010238 [Capsaspora owczarzaki ATCC 30864]|uniref:Uncharacterized protein n=1 Tax=Capsaspora owczarzaki (strain ATCC 30864) TaxID=595528 RepID=A0A0D2UTU5_CAPO3|nr:hypothetical protein CAOG_010238 [Capsaspora owczarzaki ATCC 30864]
MASSIVFSSSDKSELDCGLWIVDCGLRCKIHTLIRIQRALVLSARRASPRTCTHFECLISRQSQRRNEATRPLRPVRLCGFQAQRATLAVGLPQSLPSASSARRE